MQEKITYCPVYGRSTESLTQILLPGKSYLTVVFRGNRAKLVEQKMEDLSHMLGLTMLAPSMIRGQEAVLEDMECFSPV